MFNEAKSMLINTSYHVILALCAKFQPNA